MIIIINVNISNDKELIDLIKKKIIKIKVALNHSMGNTKKETEFINVFGEWRKREIIYFILFYKVKKL